MCQLWSHDYSVTPHIFRWTFTVGLLFVSVVQVCCSGLSTHVFSIIESQSQNLRLVCAVVTTLFSLLSVSFLSWLIINTNNISHPDLFWSWSHVTINIATDPGRIDLQRRHFLPYNDPVKVSTIRHRLVQQKTASMLYICIYCNNRYSYQWPVCACVCVCLLAAQTHVGSGRVRLNHRRSENEPCVKKQKETKKLNWKEMMSDGSVSHISVLRPPSPRLTVSLDITSPPQHPLPFDCLCMYVSVGSTGDSFFFLSLSSSSLCDDL